MEQVRRQVGLTAAVSLILGTVIGSGVFISLAAVQKAAGSPGLAVAAWLIGGLIWLPQLFILSELGTAYPDQGFGYLYLRKAGYPGLSFLYVWTVFLTSDTPSITILTLAAFQALDVFFPIFSDGIWPRAAAGAVIIILTSVHVRSVRQGSALQIVFTILKLLPLLLLILTALYYADGENFAHSSISGGNGTGTGGMLILLLGGVSATVWSYAGFPNILYMAGEVKDPRKTLPKALIISGITVAVIYTLVAYSSAALIPHDILIVQTGFVNPFSYMDWSSGFSTKFLAIAAAVSMIGAANACVMVQPRIEYAIARDGLFFSFFGKLHDKYGTPANSIIAQSSFAVILLFFRIEDLLAYFTLSYVVQNLLVFAVLFKLRGKDGYSPEYISPMGSTMLVISVLFQIGLLAGTFYAYPLGGISAALFLILSGWPLYKWFSKNS